MVIENLPNRFTHPKETENFWGELAPCEHIVQLYQSDAEFLDALEAFVSAGLRQEENVVVIATPSHRKSLGLRLETTGFDLSSLILSNRYSALDAQTCLDRFMVNGWPNEQLFLEFVSGILNKPRGRPVRVRAFGEMVALLWEKGECAATIRLEHLWGQLCSAGGFSLFCAYPRTGFPMEAEASLKEICAAHHKAFQ